MRKIRRRGPLPRADARAHELPGELVVSLTSFPARFETLDLTISSLIAQTVRPDRILLWIAHDDAHLLPEKVTALDGRNIAIRPCEDLRSYKKLIPALEACPDAYIVTADDDVYYPSRWLEQLVDGLDPGGGVITCHRAHRIRRDAEGRVAPYASWQRDTRDAAARAASTDLIPTGVGGILYPPCALDPAVLDQALFTRLCPAGDDLWFWWAARRAGTRHRKVGGKFWQIPWPSSQINALWDDNDAGGNDAMMRALEAEFGRLN